MPFVLVDNVKVEDFDPALEALHSRVIPGMRQAPGFVRGTWSADREAGRGIGVVTFDTRENAEAAKKFMESQTMPSGVTLETAAIYEVQGEA